MKPNQANRPRLRFAGGIGSSDAWCAAGWNGGAVYAVSLELSHFPAQADQDLAETTVGGVLREAAARWPEREALVEADGSATKRRWTYAELLEECELLAGALLTRFAPGEKVAVWAPNAPEWVLLEYAAALAGLTLVTVNPGYQARELAYVLAQS